MHNAYIQEEEEKNSENEKKLQCLSIRSIVALDLLRMVAVSNHSSKI